MGPWDDCSGRLQMHLALLKKSCLLSPLSDEPLERLYGELYSKFYGALMAKHMEDAVTIFQYAISNGHVKLAEHLKEIYLEYKKERKESMNTKQTIPEVKLIQRRGRCTIVKWQDGTETKVVLEEGKPDTGIFGAYCIALAKKCAGSTEKLLRTIDDHDERVMKCRYLARVQALREKRLKKAAEERKLKWENDVAAAMYDSRVLDEAIKRLWAKEEKEDM